MIGILAIGIIISMSLFALALEVEARLSGR